MRFIFAAAAVLAASCASAASAPPYHLVRGVVDFDKGPDGNSIFIDAPDGYEVELIERPPGTALV